MPRHIILDDLDFADDALVDWRGLRLTGWDGSPASTLTLLQKVRQPGAWRSSDPQLTPRGLTLTGMLVAENVERALAATAALRHAASIDERVLSVDDGLGPRTLRVSRNGEVLVGGNPSELVKDFSIPLVAADPRKALPALTRTTGLPSTTGGLSIPFTIPFSINALTQSGQIALTNTGDTPGPVVARVNGPAPQGATITHTSSLGTRVVSFNLPLAADEYLVIDMEAETVLAQGQASRNQWVTSRGFAQFMPGPNVWAFSAPVMSAATLTITATPVEE